MLKSKIATLVAAAVIATTASAADKLSGAGATFPAPLYYDWAHAYKAKTGSEVNYQSIGSGGGIKQIQKRTVNFGASDKPLTPEELKKDNLLQIPAVIGSIEIVYNLPGVKSGELKLSNEVAAGIFLGTVGYWDDAKIKKDNPNAKLPHDRITVVHRSDGSGTTWNFVYWLDKISPEWKSKVGVGTSVNWPVGIGGKGNEGVANVVKQTAGSVGYVEYAYAKQNNMNVAQLQSKEGAFVMPTTESFKAAAKNATWTKSDHFYEILALMPGKNTYPIVAATFILLPKDKIEDNKKVAQFFKFAFDNGDASADKLGYIALPAETKKMAMDYLAENGIK